MTDVSHYLLRGVFCGRYSQVERENRVGIGQYNKMAEDGDSALFNREVTGTEKTGAGQDGLAVGIGC